MLGNVLESRSLPKKIIVGTFWGSLRELFGKYSGGLGEVFLFFYYRCVFFKAGFGERFLVVCSVKIRRPLGPACQISCGWFMFVSFLGSALPSVVLLFFVCFVQPNGKSKNVTKENVKEYISLVRFRVLFSSSHGLRRWFSIAEFFTRSGDVRLERGLNRWKAF